MEMAVLWVVAPCSVVTLKAATVTIDTLSERPSLGTDRVRRHLEETWLQNSKLVTSRHYNDTIV
jgi:hypothetical protein